MATLRGIRYPLEIENGSLKLSNDTDLIRGQILSVLETEPYERVMQPDYGTPDFLFRAVPDISLIAQYIRQALERQIADVAFNVAGQLAEDGAGIITVNWAIAGIPQPAIAFRLSN